MPPINRFSPEMLVTVGFDDETEARTMTFAQFLADNHEIEPAMVSDITVALRRGDAFSEGGGAAPRWTIRPAGEGRARSPVSHSAAIPA